MGDAQILFGSLLRDHIAPVLRGEGLKGSGSTFRLKGDGVWGVINFQRRRRYSTADEIRFTVNVSVASERLRHMTYGWHEGAPPSEENCALRQRIGFMLPDRPPADWWWILDGTTDLDQLSADIAGYLIAAAVPFLRSFRKDQDLRDFWLRGLSQPKSRA